MNKGEQQYLGLLQDILDNGEEQADRTGTGTLSVFGRQLRFDLSGEDFPLYTTKRIYWKGVAYEMLWMIKGDTNIKYLQDNGVHIWDEWADCNLNLGPVYGHQLRNFGGKYKNIYQPKPCYKEFHSPVQTNDSMKLFDSLNYGKFIVLNESNKEAVVIQFINTGNIVTTRSDKIRTGNVKDFMYPSVYGIGISGIPTNSFDESMRLLYRKWSHMIKRCYHKKYDNYKYYGGKGVYVDDRWLCFTNFSKDSKKLLGWDENNIQNLELDKDQIGTGFCYSRETCKWATKKENIRAKYQHLTYTINLPNGGRASFSCAAEFAESHPVKNMGNFNSLLRGERSICEGYTLHSICDSSIGVDQLSSVINSIKNNPFSRRHVITLWNPSDLNYQALHCCHGTAIQFHVNKNRELSCLMNQRSNDLLLGNPFNVASYALLTRMIAQICNLKPKELIHSIGDAHIYLNHIDQVKEQLSREVRSTPKLKLNKKIKDIDDFQFEDFEIIDYNPHPAIKAPVAV